MTLHLDPSYHNNPTDTRTYCIWNNCYFYQQHQHNILGFSLLTCVKCKGLIEIELLSILTGVESKGLIEIEL